MIGQTISHYKITEKLGEGGMGVVYKAEDTKLERPVALKFLRSDALEDEEHKARFLREARAVASLNHPNICVIHEIDEIEGESFIAMEFVEGESVKQKIKARPLKLDEAVDIAVQTAQGLQAAHEKGVVHRDIKSSNLIVTPQGRVKVMDFGLAQLAERSQLTKTATILGTPAYMSPEQARKSTTDRRTDIWSLGVVIYEMVTGTLPFDRERLEAVLYAIGNEEPEPVTALRAGLPMELEWIVGKALAKDTDERYQHVEEMTVDLRGLGKKAAPGKPTILPAGLREQPALRSQQTAGGNANDIFPKLKLRPYQALFALTGVAVLVLGLIAFRGSPPETPAARVRRFAFTPPVTVATDRLYASVAISPNGEHIAFVAAGAAGKLWVQDLDQQEPRALEGTEGAVTPFWSPDSEFIAFGAGNELKKVAVRGGPITRICQLPHTNLTGGTWAPDGESIVFACQLPEVLYEVPAIGGTPAQLVSRQEAESAPEERALANRPYSLPREAGDRVLVWQRGIVEGGLVVEDLETGRRGVLGPGVFPLYAPSGHVVYRPAHFSYELWALPFSIDPGFPF